MISNRNLKKRVFLILNKYFTYPIILFFLLTISLYSQESPLSLGEKYSRVEQLMENLDYNGAINLLVEIVKENPDEMEKAQKMIEEIRIRKEEFNAKYEELITVLFEENDYNKGLQIIDELEQLDRNPNPATEETLRGARISAELIYFRLLFNETMDRAYAFYQEGQYDRAVSTYLTGFNFHKRTYDERNYGDLIKGPVDKSLRELMNISTRFLDDYSRFNSLTASTASPQGGDSRQTLNEAYTLFNDFADYRNSIWQAGYTFRDQNELLGEISSEFDEDFFLSFAWRIVYGRTTVEQKEGMVFVMDALWEQRVLPVLAGLEENYNRAASSADLNYRRGNWTLALENYDTAVFWADQLVRFNLLWSKLLNLDEETALTEDSRVLIERFYSKQVDYSIQNRQSELFASLSQFNSRLDNYRIYNTADLPLMTTRREILDQEMDSLQPLREEWEETSLTLESDDFYSNQVAGQAVSYAQQGLDETLGKYERVKGEITLDMADFRISPIEEEFARILGAKDSSLAYLEGIPVDDGDQAIAYIYPERSLAELAVLREDNRNLLGEIRLYLEQFRQMRQEIPQKQALDVFLDRADEMLRTLEQDFNEYERIAGRADQNIVQAERFLNEGEYRFTQSENALARNDFRQAVQELTTAQNLFVQALSYNEDLLSREETDARIAELQERILYEENREVIRYVRENVNEGKSLYLQGRYAQSEIVLLRAESRWYTTNTDENSEINYWLNLVRAALSVESGRTIEDTEPLYAEMTQFLNLAFSNFERGKRLIEQNNVTDGLRFLDQADQNLNEILIPMPLNQAASVLKLKIQQLKDPDLFREIFSEKFNSAVSRLRSATDEAYIELKDLAEIEPDYPGIQRAIYDAEILLGIRIPPPNPADLRESADLYQKAFAIVEGNVRSQFPVALAQLDRAIELNPENSAAIELKDRIQLDAGGQTTIVLSSAAQSLFKNAEEKYINGQYFEAYAIVQQLLNNRDNASYPPLQDLKRRIESKF